MSSCCPVKLETTDRNEVQENYRWQRYWAEMACIYAGHQISEVHVRLPPSLQWNRWVQCIATNGNLSGHRLQALAGRTIVSLVPVVTVLSINPNRHSVVPWLPGARQAEWKSHSQEEVAFFFFHRRHAIFGDPMQVQWHSPNCIIKARSSESAWRTDIRVDSERPGGSQTPRGSYRANKLIWPPEWRHPPDTLMHKNLFMPHALIHSPFPLETLPCRAMQNPTSLILMRWR